MKNIYLSIVFTFLSCAILYSQKTMEVYVSSKDCLKCIAGISNIIKIFEEKPSLYPMLKIITDYKSNRIRIQNEFQGLPRKNIILDKTLINRTVTNGRSICVLKDGNEINEKILIKDLNEKKINIIREWIKTMVPIATANIPDSLFEAGVFRPSGDAENIVLLHKLLQKYLVIQILGDSVSHFVKDIKIKQDEYDKIGAEIKLTKGFEVLEFDSARTLNKLTRLPILSVASTSVDGNRLLSYKNIYYYTVEGEENIANRGFVFLEQSTILGDSIRSNRFLPIEPFELEGIKMAFFIFYNHQKVSDNLYFSYYNILSDDMDRKKLENNYFGCLYSLENDKIEIKKQFKFGNLDLPDSLQFELKKFSHGNSPKYFHLNGGDYILYKNLLQILDLNSGAVINFQDFITDKFRVKEQLDCRYIFDFFCNDDKFILAYYENKIPSSLLLSIFNTVGQGSTSTLSHKTKIDYLSINPDKTTVLYKDDEKGLFELKIYPNPIIY